MLELSQVVMAVGTNVVMTVVVMIVWTVAGKDCISDGNLYSCYY